MCGLGAHYTVPVCSLCLLGLLLACPGWVTCYPQACLQIRMSHSEQGLWVRWLVLLHDYCLGMSVCVLLPYSAWRTVQPKYMAGCSLDSSSCRP
jgi:hypothetical protein